MNLKGRGPKAQLVAVPHEGMASEHFFTQPRDKTELLALQLDDTPVALWNLVFVFWWDYTNLCNIFFTASRPLLTKVSRARLVGRRGPAKTFACGCCRPFRDTHL